MEKGLWRVEGKVQGVGFRAFVRLQATSLGLRGWVRNLPDGSVEVAAAGTAPGLARLETLLWEGPPRSQVAAVRPLAAPASLEDVTGFEIE